MEIEYLDKPESPKELEETLSMNVVGKQLHI